MGCEQVRALVLHKPDKHLFFGRQFVRERSVKGRKKGRSSISNLSGGMQRNHLLDVKET